MIVEVTRASGDNVSFAKREKRYDMFFEEEREVELVDVDSWDEIHDLMGDESYIVKKGGWNFHEDNDPEHSTPSKFEGIENKVTIYDGRIE